MCKCLYKTNLFPCQNYTVRSESRFTLIKGVHERQYRPEANLRTEAKVHSDFPKALYFLSSYFQPINSGEFIVITAFSLPVLSVKNKNLLPRTRSSCVKVCFETNELDCF
jgi:hypothetical protein